MCVVRKSTSIALALSIAASFNFGILVVSIFPFQYPCSNKFKNSFGFSSTSFSASIVNNSTCAACTASWGGTSRI